MQRQGISPEMYYQLTGSTEEDLHTQFEGEAEGRVKTRLICSSGIWYISAKSLISLAISSSDASIFSASTIASITIAEMYQMPEEQIKRVLTEDMLEHDIKMKKAVELVTGTAVEKI
jgi:trigger factor